jgi:hypothetical protein
MELRLAILVLSSVLAIGTIGGEMIEVADTMPQNVVEKRDSSKTIAGVATGVKSPSTVAATSGTGSPRRRNLPAIFPQL